MLTYKDMTFCSYNDCKNFKTCHRALSEEVLNNARNWWGSEDAPICQYAEKPKCYEREKNE